ncbi:hypothetical protein FL966_01795 [Caproiciproducens galactitolivorans]|uniref:Uncharacterized protein n=1 Tax=Caproiciproducens galactitolivorans TaxID=642589 RepID=A0A4Z0YC18_9FIRM|nr:hypothetical protein [Caproiciproducens galactitolivorans]QEY33876.1 hypothetical protein FL966_01795 [Caproiciproducens galactitolivorans]TGJ75386.1 hypothetical protein CAGA_24850 [Caproiciproducens galactitolivorans]
MYDVTCVAKRYFPVKLTTEDDGGEIHSTVVEVEPPRIKTMRELVDVALRSTTAIEKNTVTENVVAELRDSIKKLLSKNKAKYRVPDEYVEAMDLDQMNGLLNAFFDWMGKVKAEKN